MCFSLFSCSDKSHFEPLLFLGDHSIAHFSVKNRNLVRTRQKAVRTRPKEKVCGSNRNRTPKNTRLRLLSHTFVAYCQARKQKPVLLPKGQKYEQGNESNRYCPQAASIRPPNRTDHAHFHAAGHGMKGLVLYVFHKNFRNGLQ